MRRLSGGAVEVTWAARGRRVEDAWIRVSADQGKTWRVAATGITERRTEINPAHLPTGRLLVQVVVHDGFHSAPSTPVAFENQMTAPVPAILHPHKGRRLVAGSTLYLWGSVAEQEGLPADAFHFTWTIDGEAAGDGLQVFARVPPPGSHHCELSVRDTKGNQRGTARVDFVSISGADWEA